MNTEGSFGLTENTRKSNLSEFLAFTLGSEEYGVDILKVQEIRDTRCHADCQFTGVCEGCCEPARHDCADH